MKYLKLDLIDDHNGQVREGCLIGLLTFPGRLPQIVSCFSEGTGRSRPRAGFCLNVVGRGAFDDPRSHISTTATITLSGEQLAELQGRGRIRYGTATVRLIDEGEVLEGTVKAGCGHPSDLSSIDGAVPALCADCIGVGGVYLKGNEVDALGALLYDRMNVIAPDLGPSVRALLVRLRILREG